MNHTNQCHPYSSPYKGVERITIQFGITTVVELPPIYSRQRLTEAGMNLPEWDRIGEARVRLLMQDEDDDMFLNGDGNSDNDGPVLL
mmetsp:Transcript_2030/g.2319  ORF Transcript_2030/g.2319 Transcript_2030/m.2319 type:complete len:87 (+) Transcript_2030:119-379(+)